MSGRRVVAWAAAVLALMCVALAVFTMRANGLLVLATLLAVAHAWAVGALRASFWVADEETSERLSTLDEGIDFVESVRSDLHALDRLPAPVSARATMAPVVLSEVSGASADRAGILVGAILAVVGGVLLAVGVVFL